jgi:ribosomal protein L20
VGRKRRKRDFKRLWICRVNAAAHTYCLSYSKLHNALKKLSIELNLKMLARCLDCIYFLAVLIFVSISNKIEREAILREIDEVA